MARSYRALISIPITAASDDAAMEQAEKRLHRSATRIERRSPVTSS